MQTPEISKKMACMVGACSKILRETFRSEKLEENISYMNVLTSSRLMLSKNLYCQAPLRHKFIFSVKKSWNIFLWPIL